MTLKTGLKLVDLCEESLERSRLHDLVAIDAGQVFRFVRAALPVEPDPFLMALETSGIFLTGASWCILTKPCDHLRITICCRMFSPVAMACGADEGFILSFSSQMGTVVRIAFEILSNETVTNLAVVTH